MHKAAKSEKGFGFHVDNTIGRYHARVISKFFHYERIAHLHNCTLCLNGRIMCSFYNIRPKKKVNIQFNV